ncbi:hypothetical protein F5884DRAFT_856307 [Xylogone sp. PMI_703]|nr:hypothetical protein F5884DRAFT_856307 [Xylogone sp. PMI_703]
MTPESTSNITIDESLWTLPMSYMAQPVNQLSFNFSQGVSPQMEYSSDYIYTPFATTPLNLSPTSEENLKLKRRRAQNRSSQRAFRERQRKKVDDLRSELEDLQTKHLLLLRNHMQLRAKLMGLESTGQQRLTHSYLSSFTPLASLSLSSPLSSSSSSSSTSSSTVSTASQRIQFCNTDLDDPTQNLLEDFTAASLN